MGSAWRNRYNGTIKWRVEGSPVLRKLFGVILIGLGVLFLIGNVAGMDMLDGWWHGPAEPIKEQKTVEGEGVKRIEVESDIASIRVIPSDNQQISAVLEGQMDQKGKEDLVFQLDQQGDFVRVKLRFDAKGSPFSFPDFESNQVELHVSLPEQLYDEVAIETHVGRIEINQLEAKQLDVETDVGKVSVERFNGEKASIHSDVGLIQVEKSKASFDLNTHTGKVEMNLDSIEQDIFIQSDTGKVDVVALNAPEALNLRLKSDVGGIDADVPGLTIEEKSEHELSGKIGSGGPTVDIRTDVGRIDFVIRPSR